MHEELLISLVEKYTELYNYDDPRYHDDQRRSNVWEEIEKTMNESPIACKEKWRNIRENYRKAIMLRHTKSGRAKLFKPIRFSSELSFIKPYIKKEQESLTNQPSVTSDDEQSYLTSPPSTPEPPVSAASSVSVKSATKKRRTKTPASSQIENKHSHNQLEEDPIVLFFRNLGQTVQQFPPDIQVRVKRDVFNIVNEAEKEFTLRNDSCNSNITEYYYISEHK